MWNNAILNQNFYMAWNQVKNTHESIWNNKILKITKDKHEHKLNKYQL